MICTNDTCSITVFVTTNMNEHVYATYTFLSLAYYIFTLAYIILCTAIPNLAISQYFFMLVMFFCATLGQMHYLWATPTYSGINPNFVFYVAFQQYHRVGRL